MYRTWDEQKRAFKQMHESNQNTLENRRIQDAERAAKEAESDRLARHNIQCRDCGEHMGLEDRDAYNQWGSPQILQAPKVYEHAHEGICRACLKIRIDEGESFEDIIAEFCS